MTFRSWKSHMTKLSHPGSLPYLPERPFPAGSNTHCPLKTSRLNLDSMGFPKSPRTLESEFRRRSYDLPKLEVMQDPSWTKPTRGEPIQVNPAGQTQPGRPSRGAPAWRNPTEHPFHETVQSKWTITFATDVRFEKFKSLTSSSLMWIQFT